MATLIEHQPIAPAEDAEYWGISFSGLSVVWFLCAESREPQMEGRLFRIPLPEDVIATGFCERCQEFHRLREPAGGTPAGPILRPTFERLDGVPLGFNVSIQPVPPRQ